MQSPQTKDGLVDEQEEPAVQEDAKTYNGSMCNTPVKRRIWARSGDSGGTVESSCGVHNFTGRILLPDVSPDGNMSGGSELASPSRSNSLPAVGMLTPPSHKTTLVYICSYCQKTFYSLVSLNAHQDDHLRDQFIEDILAMEKSFAVNYDGMRMFQDFFNAGFKCGQEASDGSFRHEDFYRTFLEKYHGDKSTGSFEDIHL